MGAKCLFHACVFPWRKLGGLMAPIGFETYGGCEKLSNEKNLVVYGIWGFPKMVVPNNHEFSY